MSDPYNPYNYPEHQPDRIARAIYKCFNCKHKWAAEFKKVHKGWHSFPQPGGSFYYSPRWTIEGYLPGCKESICPECGSNRTTSDLVTGKKNKSVPCDRRCTSARGHDCECSCGGENHGKDHVIAINTFSK